jgi:hypothetical protein
MPHATKIIVQWPTGPDFVLGSTIARTKAIKQALARGTGYGNTHHTRHRPEHAGNRLRAPSEPSVTAPMHTQCHYAHTRDNNFQSRLTNPGMQPSNSAKTRANAQCASDVNMPDVNMARGNHHAYLACRQEHLASRSSVLCLAMCAQSYDTC